MRSFIKFETKIVGGVVGDALGSFVDNFKKGFTEIIIWIVKGLFEILTPFCDWGCKSVIVISIIIFFLNKDPKSITLGVKAFFIYLIFMMLRGVVLTL